MTPHRSQEKWKQAHTKCCTCICTAVWITVEMETTASLSTAWWIKNTHKRTLLRRGNKVQNYNMNESWEPAKWKKAVPKEDRTHIEYFDTKCPEEHNLQSISLVL